MLCGHKSYATHSCNPGSAADDGSDDRRDSGEEVVGSRSGRPRPRDGLLIHRLILALEAATRRNAGGGFLLSSRQPGWLELVEAGPRSRPTRATGYCEEPVRQISGNAGYEGPVVIGQIRGNNASSYGFNAASGAFEDLVAAGVIDPTKVTRTALQNASSISALTLWQAAIGDWRP